MKGTKPRSVRVADTLWDKAIARSEADGTDLSKVIRDFLTVYTEGTDLAMRDFLVLHLRKRRRRKPAA